MSTDVRTMIQATKWEKVLGGRITSAQVALTTDKSAATIDTLDTAKTAIIDVEDGSVALELRFRCTGVDNVSDTLNLYYMAGDDDHYALMGTLVIKNGTQTDGTHTFYDGITFSAEKWPDDIVPLDRTDLDDIARLSFNTHGNRKFLLIATALNNTAVYVDYRRVG